MKNLLTKTLFILLLSSTIIPSDVQASFFTVDSKKFAEAILRVGVEVVVGLWLGIGTATIADPISVNVLGLKNVIGVIVGGTVVGGEVISAVILREKRIPTVLLALGGAIAGYRVRGEELAKKVKMTRAIVGALGVVTIERILVAIGEKITEKYFSRETTSDKIIGKSE